MKKPKRWVVPFIIEQTNEAPLKAEKKRTGASYAKIINLSLEQRYKTKHK